MDQHLDHAIPAEDILIAITPEEAFGLSWVIQRFLQLRPRPLTPLQERLAGLSLYLQDQLPDEWDIPDAPLHRAG